MFFSKFISTELTAVYYHNCHYHFIIIFIFTDTQTHFGLFSHHLNRLSTEIITNIGQIVLSETVANCEALRAVRRHLSVRRKKGTCF
jgi:hypothetical protein